MIDAVVLAAGAGRRLGGVAKATLVVGGETYLARIARVAEQAGVNTPVVVIGEPHRDVTEAEAARLELSVVENSDPSRGMGSSVAVGFRHLIDRGSRAPAALLWPVDHPLVQARTIRELVARVSIAHVVIPTCGGRGGHPALVGSELWSELAAAGEQPQGARSVFRADPARVRRIEVDDPGTTRDVDLPQEMP